jgi:uncharacterized glyoxalase superfamily protein PhnB
MADGWKWPTIASSVYYEDPMAAIEWLEKAFGFERAMIITGPDGKLAHSQLTFEDGYIMVGSPWADFIATPKQLGGKNTQMVHIQVTSDIDALYQRALAAGAVIEQAPETQFYGDRTFRCSDPGGHVWTFGQTVNALKPAEWDAASGGLTTTLGPGWRE